MLFNVPTRTPSAASTARSSRFDRLIAEAASTPRLSERARLLASLPGIGAASAAVLVAHLPELGSLDPKRAASLAGLAPHPRGSGNTSATPRGPASCTAAAADYDGRSTWSPSLPCAWMVRSSSSTNASSDAASPRSSPSSPSPERSSPSQTPSSATAKRMPEHTCREAKTASTSSGNPPLQRSGSPPD